ncbi:MAG: tetratricopeptide repeat protein [Planctomycetes bacterium]|nr:tetratricopeptide repeat protein [Planctomycetota bacterium]
MKRRIVLILVIVSILVITGGGVWWWIRRSSGTKILQRAELALQAGNFDRAIELARDYASANPTDWQGPYYQGRAYMSSGRYDEARKVLGEAAQLAPGEVKIALAMADTYAHPAKQVLEADAAGLQTDAILKAIDQIDQALDILKQIKAVDEKATLEVSSSLGFVEMELGYTYQRLEGRLTKEAEVELDSVKVGGLVRITQGDKRFFGEVARIDGKTLAIKGQRDEQIITVDDSTKIMDPVRIAISDLYDGKDEVIKAWQHLQKAAAEAAKNAADEAANEAARKAADDVFAKQTRPLTEAKRLFLDVVQKGAGQDKWPASCDRSADALVRLCIGTHDKEMLAAARESILPLADPPPMAATLLTTQGLADAEAETGWPADPKMLADAAAKLAGILEKHPDHRDALYVKLARAELALRLKDYDTVEATCKAILDVDPRQAQTRMLQATALKGRGRVADLAEAEQILFALKTDFKTWPQAHFAYAQVVYAHVPLEPGKKELAREALRTVTQLDPTHAGALIYLTEDLLRSGFYDQAFSEAKVLYDKHPGNLDAVRLYVGAAMSTAQAGLAREALQQTERKFRDSAAIQLAVSKGYSLLGDAAQAKAAAEAAAATKSTRMVDQVAKAEALLLLGRTAEAEAGLDEMVAAHPDLPPSRYLRGRLYEKTGRVMQAIDEYQAAKKLDPQDLGYRLAHASALIDAGLPDEAEADVKDILARDPANADAARLADRIRIARGEILGADEWQQAVAAGKQRGLPLARAYLNRGEPEEAVKVCEALMKEKPDDLELREVLGQAYLGLGRTEDCVKQWTALITAAPDRALAYRAIGQVLGRTKRLSDVEAELTGIPGARRELVTAAMASLLQQARQFDPAAEAYGRLAADAAASEDMRNRARLARAQCLAQAGHMDQALKELDTLAGQKPWHERALSAKAAVLAGSGKSAEAVTIIEQLRKTANTDKNPSLLARVGDFYLRLGEPEKAEKIADELEILQPKRPEPCLLRAAALSAQKRGPETIACYREAVARQPMNFGNHLTLVRVLDADGQFPEALAALEELEKQGETGKMLATAERATLLARWGLQKQAVECITQLAEEEASRSPSTRLRLGQAFARLGRTAEARDELGKIPAYAPQHGAAQQALADLAATDDERLAILRKLQTDKPNPMLTAQRMAILLRANRDAEAVKEFESFTAMLPPNTPVPEAPATGALQAFLRTGDLDKAARLCEQVAGATNKPVWRLAAALLTMDSHPETAKAMLPPAATADPFSAMIGLCLADQEGADAKVWVDRLKAIDLKLAEAKPPAPTSLPARFHVLVDVITGANDEAEKELAGIIGEDLLGKSVIGEFVSAAKTSPDAKKEATALLKASVAAEVRLPDLAHLWAMKLLHARPTFQWAASVAAAQSPSPDALRKVLALLKPDDCVLARMIQASLLGQEEQYAKAAEIYAQIAAVEKDNRRLLLNQAIALEGAGQLAEALPLYRRVWEETKDVTAANNAAYLVSELHPQDKEKLAEAAQWIDQVLKDTPNVPAFRDTKGWIQHLMGLDEQALAELRAAVRGLPDSPEVHYHLGIVEKACGNKEYARWHLQAAVDLGEGLKARGEKPSKATIDAILRAQEALTKLDGA